MCCAEVSAKFTVPLTPAGWAFGIWGLIFALEGWGVVYQLVGSGYDADGFKVRCRRLDRRCLPLRRTAGMGFGAGGLAATSCTTKRSRQTCRPSSCPALP